MADDRIYLDIRSVGEIEGMFKVPSYQRGYRWGEQEVGDLLNDVDQYNKETKGGKDYYLQPVVVRRNPDKENGEEVYDLIDGQQRLTTLYLIHKYGLSEQPKFSLEYVTRKKTKEFLDKVDETLKEENIDFWFITKAYRSIKNWFDDNFGGDEKKKEEFKNYFGEHVKIIWYEVGESEDPIDLFTRLNKGKIPLTNAELVKALFLRGDKSETAELKKKEIAQQWDMMEKELGNESFWYFLANTPDDTRYKTRMDLILDLYFNRPLNTYSTIRDKFYTLRECEKKLKDDSAEEIWDGIQSTFMVLKGWYNDHDLYHMIGYLIALNEEVENQEAKEHNEDKDKTAYLQLIYGRYKKCITHEEFKKWLIDRIKESIKFEESIEVTNERGEKDKIEINNYGDLSYKVPSHYSRICKLLLLFNIETVRQLNVKQIRESGRVLQRFPFDMFKLRHGGRKQGEKLSLEHIHAQESEKLTKKRYWIEWLDSHIKYFEVIKKVNGQDRNNYDLRELSDLLGRMKKMSKQLKLDKELSGLNGDPQNQYQKNQDFKTEIKKEAFNELQYRVLNININRIENPHKISNLALLNVGDNAYLNASVFYDKRDKIIRKVIEGEYIPLCTLRVFLKFYTASDENQLIFWGPEDREDYVKAINSMLYPEYLDHEIEIKETKQ